jgi:hypothetical protein
VIAGFDPYDRRGKEHLSVEEISKTLAEGVPTGIRTEVCSR